MKFIHIFISKWSEAYCFVQTITKKMKILDVNTRNIRQISVRFAQNQHKFTRYKWTDIYFSLITKSAEFVSLVCSPHFSSYNTELYTAIYSESHENPSCSLIPMSFCFTIDSHNKIEICTRMGIRRKIGSELNANWFIISSSCSYWIALLFMTKEIKYEEKKEKYDQSKRI